MSKRIDKLYANGWQWQWQVLGCVYVCSTERGWMRGEENKSCEVNKRESYYDKRKYSSAKPSFHQSHISNIHQNQGHTKNIAHRARLQVSRTKKQNKKTKNYKWYLRENKNETCSKKIEKWKSRKQSLDQIQYIIPLESPSMREDEIPPWMQNDFSQ